jgi:hypothetical protein
VVPVATVTFPGAPASRLPPPFPQLTASLHGHRLQIGQQFSTRVDVLSQEFIRELEKLQVGD